MKYISSVQDEHEEEAAADVVSEAPQTSASHAYLDGCQGQQMQWQILDKAAVHGHGLPGPCHIQTNFHVPCVVDHTAWMGASDVEMPWCNSILPRENDETFSRQEMQDGRSTSLPAFHLGQSDKETAGKCLRPACPLSGTCMCRMHSQF